LRLEDCRGKVEREGNHALISILIVVRTARRDGLEICMSRNKVKR